MRKKSFRYITVSVALSIILVGIVNAMPPTKEAIQQWIAEGVYDQKVANWAAFKAEGGCAPDEHSPLDALRSARSSALSTDAVDTIRVICILAEFSDWPASGQAIHANAADFDSLLFSDRNNDEIINVTGSMTDFYWENSYGTLYIQGDIYGWYMMPETYESYVGTNDGLGGGGQRLAGHAVDAAEAAGVDFSPYANGDFWVDGVIVIHAGPGAETGAYGIWSHRSNMTQRTYDGVGIKSYTLNPEEKGIGISSMGVYGHEYGHALGLPDLYDIGDNPNAEGIGNWSMMSGGSWNNGGETPAHFDAWCKMQLGFVDVVWVSDNLKQVEFPQVEHNPVVYGLKDNPAGSSIEYWLVENRQKVGFDAALPGAGLCIWHVDDAVSSQTNPLRYKVAMEQADGRNNLADPVAPSGFNGGDLGDPWPGSTNNRQFHDQSNPNSRTNLDGISEVGVWDISNSDSVMYADLDVFYSRALIELTESDSLALSDSAPGGDGDGILEAGETIEFHCQVINKMLVAFDPIATLAVNNSAIQFVQNDVALDSDLNTDMAVGNTTPIQFTIPFGFESRISDFNLTIVADSGQGTGDGMFEAVFEFSEVLGAPQILVVDDDGSGNEYERRLLSTLFDLGLPVDDWEKESAGTPPGTELSNYRTVVWHTGSNISGGGMITADDATSMKQYLDNGGNLFLSSLTGASQLNSIDSTFMADYLHATLVNSNVFGLGFVAEEGSEVFDGLQYTYDGNAPINPFHDVIAPVGTAENALHLSDDFGSGDFGICGVTYAGPFRTIFVTFASEFVSSDVEGRGFASKDTMLSRVLAFFQATYPYVSAVSAEGDDIDRLIDHNPVFGWNVRDTGTMVQTQYEMEIGTDDDWTTPEMWSAGIVVTTDTFVTYSGNTLLDGETYFLRLRVSNGVIWSEWYETTFHMNSLPSAPTPLYPVAGQITDSLPALTVLNGSDPESSSLWYQYEVYSDETLAGVVGTSPDIAENPDSTSWTLDSVLDELTPYWWRCRTYDGAEYGIWSDSAVFAVNSGYEAPTGQLVISSVTAAPCDTACAAQQVVVQASKPLQKVTIPIRIPDDVEICDISFDGLVTSDWDLNTVTIVPDSGFIQITIENSHGELLPPDTVTVFNILFNAPLMCASSYYLKWDTARYDVPADRLQFTDTLEAFSPDFDVARDSTEITGYAPGDIDGNTGVDLGDLTHMIAYLFISGPAPCPINAADINSDCEGPDLGDLTRMISYLFISGPPPDCGCLGTSASRTQKERPDIALSTIQGSDYTLVSLFSPVELRAVQLELSGPAGAEPVQLLNERVEVFVEQSNDLLTVALLDVDGPETIRAGSNQLFRIDGEYKVISAKVSDLNHSVWMPAIRDRQPITRLPDTYALSQNYPNPFNPTTRIEFALPVAAEVRLDVFNILGQRVVTLVDERLEAGRHTVDWNIGGSEGQPIASGVYFYRLETQDFTEIRKMVLLK